MVVAEVCVYVCMDVCMDVFFNAWMCAFQSEGLGVAVPADGACLLSAPMSDSASESSLALSKIKALDESVAIPYLAAVEGVVSLRVITCEICRHKSNEPNPLVIKIAGYDGRCWPFQGTDVKKRAPRMESPHAINHHIIFKRKARTSLI